jgi:hypothetical protein
MNEIIISECRRYQVQVYNWLRYHYYKYLEDYQVIEFENQIDAKIILYSNYDLRKKNSSNVINYIVKTFNRPENIKINWRYVKNKIIINFACGDFEQS